MTQQYDGFQKYELPTGQDFFLEKPLPSSPESERVILGGILLDNVLIAQAVEMLREDQFYSPLHRRVFKAMTALFERGDRIDPILIGEEMKKTGNLEAIGGVAAITNLTYGLPHFSDIEHYVNVVKDKAKVRELIAACNQVTSLALDESEETGKVLDLAQSRVNEVCAESHSKGYISIGTLAAEAHKRYYEKRDSGRTASGLLTGFKEIDYHLNGLKKKSLIILGGRPRMGKTSLMMNIVENACELEKGAVISLHSLEMSSEELMNRGLCSSANIDYDKFDRGLLTSEEERKLNEATVRFQDKKIEIDDSPGVSPQQIRSKAMMLKAKIGRLDLIAIDFLQKMTGSRKMESFRLEVGSIAKELKNLAKDLDVPVLALVSLSRECEKRTPQKPIMSDISESNVIESEADLIAFLYRDSVYNKKSEPGEAELIFAKNRFGPEGTIKLGWIGEFTRFEDFSS